MSYSSSLWTATKSGSEHICIARSEDAADTEAALYWYSDEDGSIDWTLFATDKQRGIVQVIEERRASLQLQGVISC